MTPCLWDSLDLPQRERARLWMEAKPEVMALFRRFINQLVARGRRFGINLIRERIRWETVYEYGDERFKFCNTFSPYVARRLILETPDLCRYMRCKRAKDENGWISLRGVGGPQENIDVAERLANSVMEQE